MNIFPMFCLVAGVLVLGCRANEPSKQDGDGGSGGEGGATSVTSTGGNAEGGAGGEGVTTGNGGTTGDGGSPPVGPCDEVGSGEIAAIFTAPTPHTDGYVQIAGYVVCPPGTGAVCTSVNWSDPFVGCVAAADVDTVMCVFGTFPKDTKIHYVPGLNTDADPELDEWFSVLVGGEVSKFGTHITCLGSEVVGMYDGVSFSGALSDTDEVELNGDPKANQMIVVP